MDFFSKIEVKVYKIDLSAFKKKTMILIQEFFSLEILFIDRQARIFAGIIDIVTHAHNGYRLI